SIEGKISKTSFETWLKDTKAKALQNNTLTISAPNEFAKDWLQERYTQLINDTLIEVTGANLNVKFVIPEDENSESTKSSPKPVSSMNPKVETKKTMLNLKYKFDSFVIGYDNHITHAASLAVAEAR